MNKIKQKLLNIINAIAAPVVAEITVFGMMLLLNFVSSAYYNLHYSATVINALIWSVVLTPIYVLIAYMAALIVYGCGKLNRKYLRRVVCWAIVGLNMLCIVTEACLLTFFDTYFSPTIATFLFQTTTGEAGGFIDAYILSPDFVWCILLITVVIAAIYGVVYTLKRWLNYLLLYGGIVVLSMLACIAYLGYSPLRVKATEKFPYTALSRTAQSMVRYSLSQLSQSSICQETLVESRVGASHPSIVLIIGESYNKHHSGLYGYDKEVNPHLSKYVGSEHNGRMGVFEDVIVPYNSTYKMLKEIFSLHSVDGERSWNEYPLLPHIMRDAGYYVSFISNQVPAYGDDRCGESGSYFFQYPQVAKRSFDYRNLEIYRYDMSLIEEIKSARVNRSGKPEFSIIQLKGQHIYAKYNFPPTFAKFKPQDYNDSSFVISEAQKQERADYDNATLYNDYVVEQIFRCYDDSPTIIIYMSDHGEEVHDYRPFLSRSHGDVITENEIKYQYQIPFLIYANPKFVEKNGRLVERIMDAQPLPFMADDVSHIVLGLSGVRCGWYSPSRDLLHNEYNTKRIRFIQDKQVYRKIE